MNRPMCRFSKHLPLQTTVKETVRWSSPRPRRQTKANLTTLTSSKTLRRFQPTKVFYLWTIFFRKTRSRLTQWPNLRWDSNPWPSRSRGWTRTWGLMLTLPCQSLREGRKSWPNQPVINTYTKTIRWLHWQVVLLALLMQFSKKAHMDSTVNADVGMLLLKHQSRENR